MSAASATLGRLFAVLEHLKLFFGFAIYTSNHGIASYATPTKCFQVQFLGEAHKATRPSCLHSGSKNGDRYHPAREYKNRIMLTSESSRLLLFLTRAIYGGNLSRLDELARTLIQPILSCQIVAVSRSTPDRGKTMRDGAGHLLTIPYQEDLARRRVRSGWR